MRSSFGLPLLSLYLFFIVSNSYSQDNYASNIRTTVSDEQKLFINYDIIVNDGSKYFNVELQLIYEEKRIVPNPNNLYGDFGHAIIPGSKIIYWNYSSDFSGDISKVEVLVLAAKEHAPQAVFKSTSLSDNFYAPCEIQFHNSSTYSDRYVWNFSDVNSGIEDNSFEKNPTHTFRKGGRYNISLTAFNSNLNLEKSFYETIVIKEYEPTVSDFKVIGFDNLKKKLVPITIEFKNLSKNSDSYIWDFGDPNSGRNKNTSTEQDPSHRYKNPGQYQIELTAKSSFSSLTDVKVMELALPGAQSKKAKQIKEPTGSAFERHKKMKNIWIASTAGTAVIGGVLLIRSNSLYDEYQTATENPADILKKSDSFKAMGFVSFGLSAVCAAQVVIQAKKQSEAKKQLSLQAYPLNKGGMVTLTYNF